MRGAVGDMTAATTNCIILVPLHLLSLEGLLIAAAAIYLLGAKTRNYVAERPVRPEQCLRPCHRPPHWHDRRNGCFDWVFYQHRSANSDRNRSSGQLNDLRLRHRRKYHESN